MFLFIQAMDHCVIYKLYILLLDKIKIFNKRKLRVCELDNVGV